MASFVGSYKISDGPVDSPRAWSPPQADSILKNSSKSRDASWSVLKTSAKGILSVTSLRGLHQEGTPQDGHARNALPPGEGSTSIVRVRAAEPGTRNRLVRYRRTRQAYVGRDCAFCVWNPDEGADPWRHQGISISRVHREGRRRMARSIRLPPHTQKVAGTSGLPRDAKCCVWPSGCPNRLVLLFEESYKMAARSPTR